RVLPNYSRKEYVNHIPYEKDLMNISIKQVQLKNYKLELNAPHGKLSSPKMILDSVDMRIYHDKRVAEPPPPKKMYSRMLRELPLKLRIDTLRAKVSYLSYEEMEKKTNRIGKVFFENMDIEATHLTNIDLDRDDFPETKVNFKTRFMGSSPLKVTWTFQIN